jgi:hypothetical protein
MAFQHQKSALGIAAGLMCLGLLALVIPQPATAAFLDNLFGSRQRAANAPPRPPRDLPFIDPFTSLANHLNGAAPPQPRLRADARGPSKAFCVRTCDGRYFPVRAHAGMSAVEACHSFCPASETRLYSGSNIDYATAADGSRYSDQPNAFAYRKTLVAGCTCNGRDGFGLAHIDAAQDPTLRPGDIVATTTGLEAFTGNRNDVAEFTPVENYARLSKAMRDRLAETKVGPAAPSTATAEDITASIPVTARTDAPRVQFAR